MSVTLSPSATATSAPYRLGSVVQPSPWTYRRRRLGMLAALVLTVFVLTMLIGRVGAEAELADPVAGHVVVEPGQTLWDIAVATAPDGVDPRRQLAALRELNGLDGAHLDVWTVVLIPAR
jgi:Tfp pilus assembly protein FimV